MKKLFLIIILFYIFTSCSPKVYCIKLKNGGVIYTEYYEYNEYNRILFVRPTKFSRFDRMDVNKIDTIYKVKVKDI